MATITDPQDDLRGGEDQAAAERVRTAKSREHDRMEAQGAHDDLGKSAEERETERADLEKQFGGSSENSSGGSSESAGGGFAAGIGNSFKGVASFTGRNKKRLI